MKKLIMIAVLTMTSVSAMAFQSPAQQSGTVYKAVIENIYGNPKLEDGYIRKIEVTYESARAELVDPKGKCSAISYQYWVDAWGRPTLEVDPAGKADCN